MGARGGHKHPPGVGVSVGPVRTEPWRLIGHIRTTSCDDPPRVRELSPGQAATFGRGSAGTPVDIVLPDAVVLR